MIKILSSADWHINLHKKKVPYNWQTSRFQMMFDRLHDLEKSCDVHVIAGDLFDKKPEPDEVCLLLSYLNSVTIPTIIIPGNHEATRKGASFWEHFLLENTVKNELVHIFTENGRIEIEGVGFCAFPYGSVQTDTLPAHVEGDILITHIRGEVPPHITPEYDFDKLKPWKLILLGDLHFNHRYKDTNAYYPGSPLNTTFDRDDSRQYGVDIFNLIDSSNYTREFVDLGLPKLVRRTINAGEQLVPDAFNHVVYEVTGSIDQLSKIEKSDLLDKKMVEKPVTEGTLDLKDKNLFEELEIYLNHIKVSNVDAVMSEFKSLNLVKEV
jgi:DNA repair exonuclease SbcCD nuclease subunit